MLRHAQAPALDPRSPRQRHQLSRWPVQGESQSDPCGVGGITQACFLYGCGVEVGYPSAHSAHDSAIEVFVEKIPDRAHEGVGDWRLVSNRWRRLLKKSLWCLLVPVGASPFRGVPVGGMHRACPGCSDNRLWFHRLARGTEKVVLANLFRSRAFPKGMDHAVKRNTGAGDAPCTLWGTDQKIRQIGIGVHGVVEVTGHQCSMDTLSK